MVKGHRSQTLIVQLDATQLSERMVSKSVSSTKMFDAESRDNVSLHVFFHKGRGSIFVVPMHILRICLMYS